MWWNRNRKRKDFKEEIEAHLELEADELRSEGVPSAEAPAAAQRALGNRTSIEERSYESSMWMWFEQLIRDVRYAARVLRKDATFSLLAVLVLTLSIGGNTAVFSIVNAALFKPLGIRNPDRIVGCYSRDIHDPGRSRGFSYPNYADLRQDNPVFTSLAAHDMAGVGVVESGTTRHLNADVVSSNYFATLGVPLFKGRTFTAAEEKPDSGAPVVVISYSFWKRTGSDPEIVGKTLGINGRMFTIIGIAAKGFTGTLALISNELYLPLGAYAIAKNNFAHSLTERDNHPLILIGRLMPGVTDRAADAQLAVVASQLEKAFPAENRDQTFIVKAISRLGVSPNPPRESDLSEMKVPVTLLMFMAAIVLMIASLNLANMMLARGSTRRREIAIRLAIGGGRGRIVRQLFTEGFLLASLGGSGGLVAASWGSALLIRSFSEIAPFDLVYFPGPDTRVLAMTLGFCLLSALVFGLWPAWKLSRPDMLFGLKTGSGEDADTGSGRLFSRRNVLVIAQLSLSLMLLASAGLFVRSAFQAANVQPGFALERELLVEVDPSLAGYDETRARQIFADLGARLKGVPGVESVGFAAQVPFGGNHSFTGLWPTGANYTESAAVGASVNSVTEDYFNTLGIPLLRGRTFLPSEIGRKDANVVIIDKLAAERLWPDSGSVGKRVHFNLNDVEVVGVVGSVREQIFGDNTLPPHVYRPFGHSYDGDMQIHLKVAAQAPEAQARLLETIRREILAVDDRLPILALETLSNHVETSFDVWLVNTGARMLAIFAAIAILLAVVGLYGVKAYTVARRTREIGIRMAVGADSSDVLNMVLREGLLVTAIGVVGGLVLALALGRVLSGILYRVEPIDATVLSSAALLLTGVSLLACYLPARGAARVDPVIALRHD
jgi:predicted permease